MFVLIRYAVHELNVMDLRVFNTFEEAKKEMKADVDFFFNEEVANTPLEARHKIICTDFDDNYAAFISADCARKWTWHIIDAMNS